MRLNSIKFRDHVRLPDGKHEQVIAMGNPHQQRSYALIWEKDQRVAYVRSKLDGWIVGIPDSNITFFVIDPTPTEEPKRK